MPKANWRVVNPVTFFQKFESRIYCVNNILKPRTWSFFNGGFNPLPTMNLKINFLQISHLICILGKKFQAKVVPGEIHLTHRFRLTIRPRLEQYGTNQ